MKDLRNENAYERAQHRVERLRKFYAHAIAYVVVNTGISVYKVIRNLGNGESFDDALFDSSTFMVWILWGIGLALHAFSVFGLPVLLGKNWEEDKIEEFMKEDQKDH